MNNQVVNVNQSSFQQNVVERSYYEPVLVDFWAPWCGPCRMLGPVLERVAGEPNSGFLLAKLNSDENPALSVQFNVRGIPAVKAFVNGRVVDEFVGAQPEGMVRQFVQRVKMNHKPSRAAGSKKRQQPSSDPQTLLAQARQHLQRGEGCRAQDLLDHFPSGPSENEAKKLLFLAHFICQSGRNMGGTAEVQGFYDQAASALQRRETSAALYNLLVALNQEPETRRGQPRRLMESIFLLLGDDNSLTKQYKPLVN